MPPRNRKPCRNCPEARLTPTLDAVAKAVAPPRPSRPAPVLAITSASEGERLWRHVVVGTSTCISMIEQYDALDMPGINVPNLRSMRDRLQTLIQKHEATANAVPKSVSAHIRSAKER